MKPKFIHISSVFFIYLLISAPMLLASVPTLCDTLFLKNGQVLLVKNISLDPNGAQFAYCGTYNGKEFKIPMQALTRIGFRHSSLTSSTKPVVIQISFEVNGNEGMYTMNYCDYFIFKKDGYRLPVSLVYEDSSSYCYKVCQSPGKLFSIPKNDVTFYKYSQPYNKVPSKLNPIPQIDTLILRDNRKLPVQILFLDPNLVQFRMPDQSDSVKYKLPISDVNGIHFYNSTGPEAFPAQPIEIRQSFDKPVSLLDKDKINNTPDYYTLVFNDDSERQDVYIVDEDLVNYYCEPLDLPGKVYAIPIKRIRYAQYNRVSEESYNNKKRNPHGCLNGILITAGILGGIYLLGIFFSGYF